MKVEDYMARCEALGIGRGALAEADSFPCEDGTCTLAQRQPNLINERASVKVRAASIGLPFEDLSGLNPQCSGLIARMVSARAKRRRAEENRGAKERT